MCTLSTEHIDTNFEHDRALTYIMLGAPEIPSVVRCLFSQWIRASCRERASKRKNLIFFSTTLSLRENAGLLLRGAWSTWRSSRGGAERLLDSLGIPRKVSPLLIIEHQIPSYGIWYFEFGIFVFGIWCMKIFHRPIKHKKDKPSFKFPGSLANSSNRSVLLWGAFQFK